MRKKYTKKGTCIWCGRTEADGATFFTEPHIVPHSLGGTELGVDICDDCNHYFGKAPRAGMPSIDLCFKEIFNAFVTFGNNLNADTYKHFHSAFFSYHHSTHQIKVRSNFNSRNITAQFKRGLYEVFLQKYHSVTGDGNNPIFDAVRKYARYGEGYLHVYYAFNNILLVPKDKDYWKLPMNDTVIKEMMSSGIYLFWMAGHPFFLEVLPVVFNLYGQTYLQKEANNLLINVKGDESIYEFNDVTQLDFFMQRFNS